MQKSKGYENLTLKSRFDHSKAFFKSEWKQSPPKKDWKGPHGESYEESEECKCFRDQKFR